MRNNELSQGGKPLECSGSQTSDKDDVIGWFSLSGQADGVKTTVIYLTFQFQLKSSNW